MKDDKFTAKWGSVDQSGSEIWDTPPVFLGDKVELKDWLKLVFYPKKFFLYHHVRKHVRRLQKGYVNTPSSARSDSRRLPLSREREDLALAIRILDVGCGTGATVIDFKKMFGRSVEVHGIDVVKMQVELAEMKIKKHGVWAEFSHYEGTWTEFEREYFDAIYTSDVLGHVENVDDWLKELNRILKPGGTLAMFSESKLGKHAYVRNYMMKKDLNVDPHAEFHISLHSKQELRDKIRGAGFNIEKMYGSFWASFLVHPDEFYKQMKPRRDFPFLRTINSLLYHFKKWTHPVSTAAAEFYGFVEMLTIGRWVEAQGYVVLARKSQDHENIKS